MKKGNINTVLTVVEIVLEVAKTVKDYLDKKNQK